MQALGESPEQHAELADGPEARLRIEGFYLRFVVWLVHVRQVQVETARKYFGEALTGSGGVFSRKWWGFFPYAFLCILVHPYAF